MIYSTTQLNNRTAASAEQTSSRVAPTAVSVTLVLLRAQDPERFRLEVKPISRYFTFAEGSAGTEV